MFVLPRTLSFSPFGIKYFDWVEPLVHYPY